MSLTLDVTGIKELRKLADQFPREASKALNDTTKETKNRAIRELTKEYNITKPKVEKRQKIVIIWSSASRLVAEIIPSAKRTPIFLFAGRKGGRRAKGASVEIIRGARKALRSTFVAEMKGKQDQETGHKGIFERTGKFAVMKRGRYKGKVREQVAERMTAPIASFMGSKRIFARVIKFAYKRLGERLSYRISRAK